MCASEHPSNFSNELRAANELKTLKQKFKENLSKIKDPTVKSEIDKKTKHFFKYTNRPKLHKVIKENEIAIFEAPLANKDILAAFYPELQKLYEVGKPNHSELKRLAKHTLKALAVLHSEGKVHGDIHSKNILSTSIKGKTTYTLTDFGRMTNSSESGEDLFWADIAHFYCLLLDTWALSISKSEKTP